MAESSDEKRLYKIGEVCRMAGVQPDVLRYWETEVTPLAPKKSGGGQRLYTKREIDIVLLIKQLLYSEGFTIAGAKKKLEVELAGGTPALTAATPVAAPEPAVPTRKSAAAGRRSAKTIERVRKELTAILDLLAD